MIYLDNNATTVVEDNVISIMEDAYRNVYGNPNSIHHMGNAANHLIEDAREKISCLLKGNPKEIYFTSSATESINWVLRSATLFRGKKTRVVTTAIEHKAVLNTLKDLKNLYGIEIVEVNPDKDGIVPVESRAEAIDGNTFLVSIMAANNVTGTIQPFVDVGHLLKNRGIMYHIDAVQTIGKLPFDVQKAGCDFASFSAHKFHGPKGTGILYAKSGTKLRPLITGGGQERGMRSGTQNVPGIVGTAAAMELAFSNLTETMAVLGSYKRRIIEEIREIDGRINSHPDNSICNTLNFSLPGIRGEVLVNAMAEDGVCLGTSSACYSRNDGGQNVLDNMVLSKDQGSGAVRLSMSRKTTGEEIETFVAKLKKMVTLLKF